MSVQKATLHPDVLKWETTIEKINEDGTVVLEDSYFYTTAGGQPCDTGLLVCNDQEIAVTEVRNSNGRQCLSVEESNLEEGAEVQCVIDEDRRKKHMRVHTAMHVLCAVIERDQGTHITGGQIDVNKSRVDVNLQEYNPELMQKYVEKANEVLLEDHPVTRKVINREELDGNPEIVKLAKGFPEHIKDIHIVDIQGIDVQPCGGTHMDNTKDIGQIKLIKTKNMGKNNRRIYFTVE